MGEIMRFGEAIEYAREGMRIARHGWYGTGVYIYMTNAHTVATYAWMEKMPSQKLTEAEKRDGGVLIESHLDMMTARGTRIIGWSPTNADILSNDWYLLKEDE